MHAYITRLHTYSNTNHIITYIHNFQALQDFVPRIVARSGFNTIFATRVGIPVRTNVLKTAFRAAAKNVTVGGSPHVDPVPLVKKSFRFYALAAKSIKNGPCSGAVAEKDVASEARSAPVPGGPEASKTVCFQMFLKNE